MYQSDRGFTLIELIIAIAIVAITLGIAVPGWSSFVETNQRKAVSSRLISLINLSRNTAVSEGTAVTFCPLDEDGNCSGDWSQPITAFRDPHRQHKLLADDQVIRILESPETGRLLGHTGIQNYFGFRPSGLAVEANGNLQWCPDDEDAAKAIQIVINRGGRPRLAQDNDGDGIVEDANGDALSCDV